MARGWVSAIALASAGALVPGAAAQTRAPVWSGRAEPEWRRADTLVLQGTSRRGVFVPKSLNLPEQEHGPAAARLLPLTGDILPLLRPRAFGTEERVVVSAGSDGLRIACRAGSQPAGVVLEPAGHRYPRNMAGSLVISGSASAPAGLSLVRSGSDAPVPAQAAFDGRAVLALRQDASALVVTCPLRAGEITLREVRIEPASGMAARYGTWLWNPGDAIRDPVGFSRSLAALGLDDIAIQAPANPLTLLPVLDTVLDAGIALHLVEGDPDMIAPEGLRLALERVRRLREGLQRLGPAPALRLELDIEPYGRADYALDPAAAWRQWAAAVSAIARVWGSSVDVDVPWWMLEAPGAGVALRDAQADIGTIVVMAYRTDPDLILAAAEPWLALEVPVKIAIEAGAVDDEVQRTYRRAPAGELEIGGDRAVLHAAPVAETAGTSTFALAGETRTRAERVSFHGRDTERRAAEQAILRFLTAWPSFHGLRVHGLPGVTREVPPSDA